MAWVMAVGASAQLNGDGYYRVQNYKTGRYVYVMDDKGSLDVPSTTAEVGAIELWKGHDKSITDPASVIYVTDLTGKKQDFDFQAQGTGVKHMINHPVSVILRNKTRGTYAIFGRDSGMTRWLGDGTISTYADRGYMSTNQNDEYTEWYFHPINSSTDEYFGVAPTVKVGNEYYQPFFADFPFTTVSSGMEVFYIYKVDNEDGVAVLKKINGTVPRATPVLIKCASAEATNNRLNIGGTASNITDNVLKAVYFENYDQILHTNLTPFNKSTMRLLNVNASGELVYSTADVQYIPRNQAYLTVSANAPAEIKVMTQEAYNEFQKTKPYTLTYMVDDKVYKTLKVKAGDTITPEAAPEKEGHTFVEWTGLPTVMPSHNVTVTAKFSVNTYTMTYYIDWAEYKKLTYQYGQTVVPEPEPEPRAGFTFSGWNWMPKTMPAENVQIYANWINDVYKVTYLVDGEVFQEQSVKYMWQIPKIDDPVKEGYTFKGWDNLPVLMPLGDITVNAVFDVNAYTLNYIVDGTAYRSYSVNYGTAIKPETEPVREGYSFSGWQGLPATMPAHDVDVTGAFEINRYSLKAYIDNVLFFETTLSFGEKVTVPEPELADGQKFSHWDETVPETMPAHDVELHGHTISTGIDEILASMPETHIDVYDISGVLVLHNVSKDEAKSRLNPGIYIIAGIKVIVR